MLSTPDKAKQNPTLIDNDAPDVLSRTNKYSYVVHNKTQLVLEDDWICKRHLTTPPSHYREYATRRSACQ